MINTEAVVMNRIMMYCITPILQNERKCLYPGLYLKQQNGGGNKNDSLSMR